MTCFCPNEDFRQFAELWSQRWYSHRGRVPFFLLQRDDEQIEGNLLKFMRGICPGVPAQTVDLVIHSGGGNMDASFQVALVLQSYFDYSAVVPLYAKSGATLVASGATEIIMGRWAELGPLDPQTASIEERRHYFMNHETTLEAFHAARFAQQEVLKHFVSFTDYLIMKVGLSPISAIQESIKLTEATIGRIYSNVNPFELGNSGRILEVMERYCVRVMGKSYKGAAKNIAQHLVWDYPTHGFYIDLEEARKTGLNAVAADDPIQALLDELAEHLGKHSCYGYFDLPASPLASGQDQDEQPASSDNAGLVEQQEATAGGEDHESNGIEHSSSEERREAEAQ